jgi:catalase
MFIPTMFRAGRRPESQGNEGWGPGEADQEHVGHLGAAQKRIRLRQAALFYKPDPNYGKRVATGLKLDMKEVEHLANQSQEERARATT